jgi:hypothetical protein
MAIFVVDSNFFGQSKLIDLPIHLMLPWVFGIR